MTYEEAKAALEKTGYVRVRDCTICYTPVGYVLENGRLAFDGNCGCVSYRTPPEPRTWDDLKQVFPETPNPEIPCPP